jgi:hypothetical protein
LNELSDVYKHTNTPSGATDEGKLKRQWQRNSFFFDDKMNLEHGLKGAQVFDSAVIILNFFPLMKRNYWFPKL